MAIEQITSALEQRLSDMKNNTKFFILVLDGIDVLLYDKRGKPSDFIYKLLVMEENLKGRRVFDVHSRYLK